MWEKMDSFEPLYNGEKTATHRLKVPGGWIVQSIYVGMQKGCMTQTFVPDAEHTWVLEPK